MSNLCGTLQRSRGTASTAAIDVAAPDAATSQQFGSQIAPSTVTICSWPLKTAYMPFSCPNPPSHRQLPARRESSCIRPSFANSFNAFFKIK